MHELSEGKIAVYAQEDKQELAIIHRQLEENFPITKREEHTRTLDA